MRLTAMVRAQIISGTLQPGQQVPSITYLSREHGHSRQACGRAYQKLEKEGLVKRFPGLGYYVA